MLRKCKLEVVVAESVHCYNEITKSKEDFIMKLSDKIVRVYLKTPNVTGSEKFLR